MHKLNDKTDASEENKEERLKEEHILEEVNNMQKIEKDVPEELPRTDRRSDASKYVDLRDARGEWKDEKRTPTSLRKVRKIGSNSKVSSSPSLKHIKVATLRKLLEPGLTDRDVLPTTSPLTNRSGNKSMLNPSKCADQW